MNFTFLYDGVAGTTVTFTATSNDEYTVEDMGVETLNSSGKAAVMLLISIENAACRVCFNGSASQTLGHFKDYDQALQISGKTTIDNLSLANAVAGNNFTVQLTPFFLS